MSPSDWRSSIVIVGGVVAGVLLAVWFSILVAQGPRVGAVDSPTKTRDGQLQQTADRDNHLLSSNIKRQLPPADYKPDCSKREDADLCAQLRMAIAAEEQGRLNMLGLLLLAATLGFTAWAAISARSAAMATGIAAVAAEASADTANKTLRAMGDTAQRQLRAYVNVFEPRILDLESGTPTLRIRLKNFGQTPAYQTTAKCVAQVMSVSEDVPPALGDKARPMQYGTLGPGETFSAYVRIPLGSDLKEAILKGEKRIIAIGEVRYKDAFGEPRVTPLHMQYGGVLSATMPCHLMYLQSDRQAD
jgi:hypothetical protein